MAYHIRSWCIFYHIIKGYSKLYNEGMHRLGRFWKRIPKPVRAPLVFIVGVSVIAAGIVMLVIPGPGWAAIFVGFAILATEFAFAEKVRDWLIGELKRLFAWAKSTWTKFRRRKH